MNVCIVIPAHGRLAVSRVAFSGISWCLDVLLAAGVTARALVVAADDNLDEADALGFETLERPNVPLGKKWNDGYETACRDLDADYVLSCGSDDWIHPSLILAHLEAAETAPKNAIFCSRLSTVVAPDGSEAVTIRVGYASGDGVRMLPRRMLQRLDYRPYLDARNRALDGGMIARYAGSAVWTYTDLHPFQIVDFKSRDNLTPYEKFRDCEHEPQLVTDPLARLLEHYPAGLIDRAGSLYAAEAAAA